MQFRSIYHAYHRGLKSARITSAVEHLARSRSTDSACLILVKLCPGWQQLPDAWWPLLQQMARSAVAPSAAELAPLIDLRQANLMSAPDWLRLSSMLIALRNFQLASQIREMAKQRIRDYMGGPDRALYCDLAIGLLMEEWQLEVLPKYLRWARWLRTECGRSPLNRTLAAWVKVRRQAPVHGIDAEYAAQVQGRSVAVVGPLQLSSANELELDNFDLIVGVNDAFFLDAAAADQPARPDIVYFTGSVQARLELDEPGDFSYSPAFIIGKRQRSAFKRHPPDCRYRQMPQYNHFILNGSLNMIPRIMLDLTLHEPARLKLFGADLYASTDYRADYAGIPHDQTATVLKQHVGHDLISQFNLMYNLYRHGCYEADERLSKVLNMGLIGYLNYFNDLAAADNANLPLTGSKQTIANRD